MCNLSFASICNVHLVCALDSPDGCKLRSQGFLACKNPALTLAPASLPASAHRFGSRRALRSGQTPQLAAKGLVNRSRLPVVSGFRRRLGAGAGPDPRQGRRGCLSLACVDVAATSGTEKEKEERAFAGLRRHESSVERSLREFELAESTFEQGAGQGGVLAGAAQRAADGISALVKCRHMSRHIRALEGGKARLEALQHKCAAAVADAIRDVEPSQMAVACNSLALSSHPSVVAMYAAVADALMGMEARDLRPRDTILVLNSLARAAGAGQLREPPALGAPASGVAGTQAQWKSETGRLLALHLCKGLVSQRHSSRKRRSGKRGKWKRE